MRPTFTNDLLISTEAAVGILGSPGVGHPVEGIPVGEHQGNPVVVLLPVGTLVVVEHLVDIPEEELHRVAGSNLAGEHKQELVQDTLAELEGFHKHMDCSLLAWVCRAGMAWACHLGPLGMGGDLELLRKGLELLAGRLGEELCRRCWTHWEGVDEQEDHSYEVDEQGHGGQEQQEEDPVTC